MKNKVVLPVKFSVIKKKSKERVEYHTGLTELEQDINPEGGKLTKNDYDTKAYNCFLDLTPFTVWIMPSLEDPTNQSTLELLDVNGITKQEFIIMLGMESLKTLIEWDK